MDQTDHPLKEMTSLFLDAMLDWPRENQDRIIDFVKELEEYFGTPLTREKIKIQKINDKNLWQMEAGSSIINLINISINVYNESDFENILNKILTFYEQEFSKVDLLQD